MLLARLLLHLLLRVELTWHHLLTCGERLESIVRLLLHSHRLVRHEGVWPGGLLHLGEWICATHVLLCIQHHARLELLLHVGSHHLHHLVLLLLLLHELLLLVAHRVRDEGGRLLRLLLSRSWVLSHWDIHRCEWIVGQLLLCWLLLGGSGVEVEDVNGFGCFRTCPFIHSTCKKCIK